MISSPQPSNAVCQFCNVLPGIKVSWIPDPSGAKDAVVLRADVSCECGTVALSLATPDAAPGRLPLTPIPAILDAWREAMGRMQAQRKEPGPAPTPTAPGTCGCGCNKPPVPTVDERLDAIMDWYNDRLAALSTRVVQLEAKMSAIQETLSTELTKLSEVVVADVSEHLAEQSDARVEDLVDIRDRLTGLEEWAGRRACVEGAPHPVPPTAEEVDLAQRYRKISKMLEDHCMVKPSAPADPNASLREEIRRREQNQDMHLNPWKWFSLDPREV